MGKIVPLCGKVLTVRTKTRPAFPGFTLCLPGSPKVNAGGACGAWLPGRELLRTFRFDDRIEGIGGLFCLEVITQPGTSETSSVPELAAFAGTTFDELVQWMVEDASIDR
jgi:D-ala D-ala ligase C-terminus